MLDEATKHQLIEQFRAYLEMADEIIEAPNVTDLFSLFTELSAIRNEVKLEARQFKIALDQLKTTSDLLQSTQNRLLEEIQDRYRRQQQETVHAFLLEILEIYDRLEAATRILDNYKSFIWVYLCKREARVLHSLQEGHAITMRRVTHLLNKYQVYPLEVLHQPFNPHYMQAVDSDSQPQLDNGLVTSELRKGFKWGGEILRPAEVKVNKKDPQPIHSRD